MQQQNKWCEKMVLFNGSSFVTHKKFMEENEQSMGVYLGIDHRKWSAILRDVKPVAIF